MNTIHNRKKSIASALGAAAVAAAVPAAVLFGAGTAAAAPLNPVVDTGSPLGGVTVQITDNGYSWPPGLQNTLCWYSAQEQNGPGAVGPLLFNMVKQQEASVVIWPAFPTNTMWDTTVNCPSTTWGPVLGTVNF
jgi:hypothetical protein